MKVISGIPPSFPDIEETGGDSGWVTLTRASGEIDAHLLMGRLSEAGVESNAVRDISGAGAWMYGGSNPFAPVTILVKKLQYEDARLVLAEISFEGPPAEPREQYRRRSWFMPVAWWVLAIAIGVLLTGLSLYRMASARPEGARCQIPIFCGSD